MRHEISIFCVENDVSDSVEEIDDFMKSNKRHLPNGPVSVLRGHTDSVSCVDFIRCDICVSGALNGELLCWNISTNSCLVRTPVKANDTGKGILSVSKINNKNGVFMR